MFFKDIYHEKIMKDSQRRAMMAKKHLTVSQADKIGKYPVLVKTKNGYQVLASSHAESDNYSTLKKARQHLKQEFDVMEKHDKLFGLEGSRSKDWD